MHAYLIVIIHACTYRVDGYGLFSYTRLFVSGRSLEIEHWRSRAAVAVGSRRQISRWCRSAGAGGGTAAIDPFLYVRVVVPLPTRTPHIYVPGRAGLPAACGGAWYGYDTVRYGAVCSSLACLTVRRRRARLRSGQGRACQRAPTQPPPEDRLQHEPTQANLLGLVRPQPSRGPLL